MKFPLKGLFFLALGIFVLQASSVQSQTLLIQDSFYQTEFSQPSNLPSLFSQNNLKTVDKTEVEIQNLTSGVWLNYRIRFQNNTNATIANIRIKDSLSSYLDYNTFQFTGSSHAGQFLLYTSGNLYIYYNSINLPDSATDNVGSQGSFRFKIKLKESLPLGTCIKNSAEINFDFNPPVYTNTVQTDIVQYTSVFGNAGNNSVHLYPNPTSNVLKIDWNQAEFDLIQILDVTGKLVMAKSISPGVKSERVNLSHLDAGIYLLHLKGNEDYKSLRFIMQ